MICFAALHVAGPTQQSSPTEHRIVSDDIACRLPLRHAIVCWQAERLAGQASGHWPSLDTFSVDSQVFGIRLTSKPWRIQSKRRRPGVLKQFSFAASTTACPQASRSVDNIRRTHHGLAIPVIATRSPARESQKARLLRSKPADYLSSAANEQARPLHVRYQARIAQRW